MPRQRGILPRPFDPSIITIEDAANATPDRGWIIATTRTGRIVDVHSNPPDAVAAQKEAKTRMLPCTMKFTRSGKLSKATENSYAL